VVCSRKRSRVRKSIRKKVRSNGTLCYTQTIRRIFCKRCVGGTYACNSQKAEIARPVPFGVRRQSGLRPQRPEDASIILGESTKSVSFSPDPDRALDAIGDMWRGNSAAVLKLRSSAIKKHRIYDIAGMTYGGDASDFAITQEHRIFETIAPEDLEVAGVVDLSGLSYGDIKLVLKGMKPKPLSAYRKGKRGGLFKKTKSGKRTYKKKGGK